MSRHIHGGAIGGDVAMLAAGTLVPIAVTEGASMRIRPTAAPDAGAYADVQHALPLTASMRIPDTAESVPLIATLPVATSRMPPPLPPA